MNKRFQINKNLNKEHQRMGAKKLISKDSKKSDNMMDSGYTSDSSIGSNVTDSEGKIHLNGKIHHRNTCKCVKLQKIFKENPETEIIICKLYHDNPQEDKYPDYILIKNNKLEEVVSFPIERKLINNYFSDHVGDLGNVRRSVESISSLSYCNSLLEEYPNAGSILLGSLELVITMSGSFNYYFKNKLPEFQELLYCKISEIKHLKTKYKLDHTVIAFLKSTYYQAIIGLDELYTILGWNSKTNTIGFSFGKREFIDSTSIEDSYQCAKRELFEEFRFNLSYDLNQLNKNKYYVQYGCCRLYPLIIPPNTRIHFDDVSKTIVFSLKF